MLGHDLCHECYAIGVVQLTYTYYNSTPCMDMFKQHVKHIVQVRLKIFAGFSVICYTNSMLFESRLVNLLEYLLAEYTML